MYRSSPYSTIPGLGWSSAKHTGSTDILPITQALEDTTKIASDRERGIHHHVSPAEVGILLKWGSI